MTDEGADTGDVLVLIAAYNEGTVVGEVVTELRSAFPRVLVVDDGSNDDTQQAAESAGAFVVRHMLNIGQGGALTTGLRVMESLPDVRWVVTFDADGQHRVEDALEMVAKARRERLDIVLGSRFNGGGSNASQAKLLLLRAATAYTRASTGLPVTDTHNGLRVLSADLARKIAIQDFGMGHATDILEYVAEHDVKWAEFPVTIRYTDYSKAKGQSMSNAVNILFDRWVR